MTTTNLASSYIPSGSSIGTVLSSLSDHLEFDLALPGNWSPKLFFDDLKNCPVREKNLLAETIRSAMEIPISYLSFFEVTRGYPRATSEQQREIMEIFERGSVMLYFEPLFLDLIRSPNESADVLLKYIKTLSQLPIARWNEVVGCIGASSYQYFAQDPHSYVKLLTRVKDDDPEDLMDDELLEIFPDAEANAVSRADLIKIYREAQI